MALDPDKPEDLERQIDALVKAYEEQEKKILMENAAAAYIAGDLTAQKALDIKLSFNLLNKEAVKYLKEYKEDLARGGSTIQGEFIPWLKDKNETERSEIAKIIEEGYKKGLPTGVREYKRGGYPKNSIAAQLQEHFNARKSHASTVARTEIARIQSHGSLNRYQKQSVKKVMWLVFHPCPICAQWARRVFDINDLPREIPAHPNCRCAFAPVPDDIPTGPAPDQEIPEVFERNQKALPPRYTGPEIRERIPQAIAEREAKIKAQSQLIKETNEEYNKAAYAYNKLYYEIRDTQHLLTAEQLAIKKAELKKLEDELSKIDKVLTERMAVRNALFKSDQDTIRELLFIDEGEALDLFTADPLGLALDAEHKKIVDNSRDFLNRLLSSYTKERTPNMIISLTPRRSWTDIDNIIRLRDTAKEPTLIHEVGHNLEFSNPRIWSAAKGYLRGRTQGEEARKLSEITGIDGFGPGEIAKADKFIDPYIGRIYPDGSTEVVSMGLQLLYEDPRLLASKDPELFDLMIKIVRGDFD